MTSPLRCMLALALSILPAVATAQTAAPATAVTERDRALLGGQVAGQAQGRTGINQAAGSGNTQVNLAAIALSSDAAALQLQSRQSAAASDARRDASARIDAAAFQTTRGLLSVNQAAGAGNAQANLIGIGRGDSATAGLAIAQGITGLPDAALASVTGDTAVADPSTPPAVREAVIAGDALRSSQGVVQINQSAGAGNRSANAIVLLLPGGAP